MAGDEGRAPLVEDVAMEVEVRGPVVAANYTTTRHRTASRAPAHFNYVAVADALGGHGFGC